MTTAIFETALPSPIHRGKVRDTYDLGGGLMLMVATDRISAFDVVLPTPVPGKGAVLSQMSAFWFDLTRDAGTEPHARHGVRHGGAWHLVGNPSYPRPLPCPPKQVYGRQESPSDRHGVRRQGIHHGRGLGGVRVGRDPQRSANAAGNPGGGTVRRNPCSPPSTKAESGHDIPISRQEGENLVGTDLYARLEELSLKLYAIAHDRAEARAMILADTKFEFGFIDGEITLIDELLTPDSSRFWGR